MKLFRQLTLLLISLTAIYSCSTKDFDRTPILVLSEKALTFTREADVKNVEVTINDADEFYCVVRTIGTENWLTATKTQEGFEVRVEANIAMLERVGTIEVYLKKGNLMEKITVSQVGEGFISVSPENASFSNKEGELTIYVESNVEWEATIEGAAPWLTIEKHDRKLNVKVLENTSNKRTAKIKVARSGIETFIEVIQKGAMHYDFPFLMIGYHYDGEESERGIKYPNSIGDANKFERERGSVLYTNSSAGMFYKTKSSIFPKVAYGNYQVRGSAPKPSVKIATLIDLPIKPFALLDDADFVEYMYEEGFEFAWRNNDDEIATYWDKEREIALQFLNYDDPNFGNRLTFTHARTKPNDPTNQTDAYPTFDAMPEACVEFGSSTAKVLAWEKERGSIILESNADVVIVAPDKNKEPYIIERVYTFEDDGLVSVLLLLNHIDKAFYFTGDMYDREAYCLTKEFFKLMNDAGSELLQSSPPSHFFHNAKEKLIQVVYVDRYEAEGFLPRLAMQIMHQSAVGIE